MVDSTDELAGLDEEELDEYVSGRRVSPGERDYVSMPGARKPSVDLRRSDDAEGGEGRLSQRTSRREGRFEGSYSGEDRSDGRSKG